MNEQQKFTHTCHYARIYTELRTFYVHTVGWNEIGGF